MIVRAQNLVMPGANDANAPLFCIDNVITSSNVTATSTNASYPLSNLGNPATFLEWRGNDATAANNVVITVPSGSNPNYVGIAKHNLFDAERTIRVQGDTGTGYANLTDVFTPPDNKPILMLFEQANYTAIRLVISAGTSAPRIGAAYCGAALVGERNIYVGHSPITLGKQQRVINGRSESGNFLGRIITGESTGTSVELTELTPGWVRGDLDPFIQQARSRPFFFGWRPETYPEEVGYVWLTGAPSPYNTRPNGLMAVSFDVEGVA